MKKLKMINTIKVPTMGPYSQAIVAGDMIYCSGQIGISGKTNLVVEGIEKQTHQVLDNLINVLRSAKSNLNHVVKTTIYIKNISDFQTVNTIYGEYFKTHLPARASVEVSRLPMDVLIEIDAIAIKI